MRTLEQPTPGAPRTQLLAGVPVRERTVDAAGISTSLVEGGDGSPLVLLHGPGESAAKWLRVLGPLADRHRVVAPDLPCHGASGTAEGGLDEARALAWVDDLVERTCSSPPVLVGHVLGGAIAARFAAARGDRLAGVVLVDSLGLARFRPAPRFALDLIRFQARPTRHSYKRFMRRCSFDLDGLRGELGERWEPSSTTTSSSRARRRRRRPRACCASSACRASRRPRSPASPFR